MEKTKDKLKEEKEENMLHDKDQTTHYNIKQYLNEQPHEFNVVHRVFRLGF